MTFFSSPHNFTWHVFNIYWRWDWIVDYSVICILGLFESRLGLYHHIMWHGALFYSISPSPKPHPHSAPESQLSEHIWKVNALRRHDMLFVFCKPCPQNAGPCIRVMRRLLIPWKMTPNRLLDEEKDWSRNLYCISVQGGRIQGRRGRE